MQENSPANAPPQCMQTLLFLRIIVASTLFLHHPSLDNYIFVWYMERLVLEYIILKRHVMISLDYVNTIIYFKHVLGSMQLIE